jgi:hypothetical protein
VASVPKVETETVEDAVVVVMFETKIEPPLGGTDAEMVFTEAESLITVYAFVEVFFILTHA